jgi:rod shape-determining protein MreD
LRATLVEGAFTAFSVGYLLGVFTGRPTGLFPFLAVLIFLLVRATSAVVDARARSTTAMLTLVATLLHGLLAFFFTWLTAKGGASTTFSFGGLILQAFLSAVAGALLFPLFRRIEPGEHPAPGGLQL